MSRARWIHNPAADALLALCWVPFAWAAHAAAGDRDAIALVLTATFALSFAHQPLTLPIVYGDPEERASRPVYRWFPLVLAAAVVAGLQVSVAAVAIVAGLWNIEHTLMQRFGISRIYGRKVGEADAVGARVEKAMLVSWLVLAAVGAAAQGSTAATVRRLPLGEVNAEGLRLLTDLRDVAAGILPLALVAAAAVTARWVADERRRWRGGGGNAAKLLYLGSTAALIGLVIVEPVAGFVGYVGAHAVEYFVVVHTSLANRWTAPGSGGELGRLMRAPGGRARFLAAYALLVGVLLVGLYRWGSPHAYLVVALTFGGMHVLYDGFVWKLRRPAVAAGLVAPAPAQPMAPIARA